MCVKVWCVVSVVNGLVFVEDMLLCYDVFGGFLGVYVKWFLEKMGLEGFVDAFAAYDDKSVEVLCVFVYVMGLMDEVL